MCDFESLIEVLKLEILSHLDLYDLLTFQCTNKHYYKLIKDSELFVRFIEEICPSCKSSSYEDLKNVYNIQNFITEHGTKYDSNEFFRHEELELKKLTLEYFPNNIQLPNLKRLYISKGNIYEFSNIRLPNLEILDLCNDQLKVFSNNNLPKLQSLNLFNNFITIFSDNYLPMLQKFSLGFGPFRKFYNNYLPMLQKLKLNHSDLNDFHDNYLPNLEELYFHANCLTIFSNQSLPNLTVLRISFNDLTEFSNNHFPKLQKLYISNNTNLNIFSGNNLASLKEIEFDYIPPSTISKIRNDYPNVKPIN